jgi:hypothetical protein
LSARAALLRPDTPSDSSAEEIVIPGDYSEYNDDGDDDEVF